MMLCVWCKEELKFDPEKGWVHLDGQLYRQRLDGKDDHCALPDRTRVEDKTCYAYFRGKDGLGTCDTECQWYVEGESCPWWEPEETQEVKS